MDSVKIFLYYEYLMSLKKKTFSHLDLKCFIFNTDEHAHGKLTATLRSDTGNLTMFLVRLCTAYSIFSLFVME